LDFGSGVPVSPLEGFMTSFITVPLTQGFVAFVDAEDYDRVAGHKWHAVRRSSGLVYAATNIRQLDGRQKSLQMHRLLLPEAERVDHINGIGTDNRRENLRSATHTENMQNRKKHKNNTSGFKGVYAAKGRWRAAIRANGQKHNLGYFDSPEEASAAYDEASQRLHGEFSRPNN
jgi:hypothetical protein